MEEILPEHFHKIGGKMNVTNGGIREVNPMTCGYGSIIWYSGQSYELVELEAYTLAKKKKYSATHIGKIKSHIWQTARPWRRDSTISQLSHKVWWWKGLIIHKLLFPKPRHYTIKYIVLDDNH